MSAPFISIISNFNHCISIIFCNHRSRFPSTDESCDEVKTHELTASSSSPLRRRHLRHGDNIGFSSSSDSGGEEATGSRGQRLSVHPRLQYETTSSSSSDEDYYCNSGSGPFRAQRWRQRRGRTEPLRNSSSHLRIVAEDSQTTPPRASASNCDDRQEGENLNTTCSTPPSPSVTPVPSSSPPHQFASPDDSSFDKCTSPTVRSSSSPHQLASPAASSSDKYSSPPAPSSSPQQESHQIISGGNGITPLIISSDPGSYTIHCEQNSN